MSLRTRIAAAAGVAVAIVVVIAAVAIYLGVRAELRGEVDDSLRDQAAALTGRVAIGGSRGAPGDARVRPPAPGGGPAPLPPLRREPFGGPEGYAQLVLPTGRALRRPGVDEALPVDSYARGIARSGSGRRLADETVDGTHLRVLTQALPGRGAIQVARPLSEVDRQLDRVLLVLVIVGAAGVALGAVLAGGVARTALAPIGRFTRRTEEIAGDPDPSHRIEVRGEDELARLARSFNATLDSLERSVEAQRHLVADASHELRTPIASLRANIQTLEHAERLPAAELTGLRADIVAELDELTALVADIVELARGAKRGGPEDEVRLDEIVESVVQRARTRANGIAIEVAAEPTVVRGAPDRIQRAVSNLVDNALKWSPSDGRIQIDLAGGRLSVRDHGPGFKESDIPHVFDRFYRADGARALPGSGLGLAIVRQAAEAHGGDVEAANAPGGGAVVSVSFGNSG